MQEMAEVNQENEKGARLKSGRLSFERYFQADYWLTHGSHAELGQVYHLRSFVSVQRCGYGANLLFLESCFQ